MRNSSFTLYLSLMWLFGSMIVLLFNLLFDAINYIPLYFLAVSVFYQGVSNIEKHLEKINLYLEYLAIKKFDKKRRFIK